jgi:hypothetical protein
MKLEAGNHMISTKLTPTLTLCALEFARAPLMAKQSGDRNKDRDGGTLRLTFVNTLAFASVIMLTPLPAHAELTSGDIWVIDLDAGTNARGALFSINPASAARMLRSDFGDAAQGALGQAPVALTLNGAGNVLVIDDAAGTGSRGALFSVDPATGSRTLLSNFGNTAQGPLGKNPSDVAIDAAGNILIVDRDAGTGELGALFIVDPASGARTLLSDLGDVAQGAPGVDPRSLAFETSGSILVIDSTAGTNGDGAIFSVDPATGSRTLLSNFGDTVQGPRGRDPSDLAIDAAGSILVIDRGAGPGNLGALFRVDPSTGARVRLSEFGNTAQGPLGQDPFGMAIDAAGSIQVSDYSAGTAGSGALFSVDPLSGTRVLRSDFGDAA